MVNMKNTKHVLILLFCVTLVISGSVFLNNPPEEKNVSNPPDKETTIVPVSSESQDLARVKPASFENVEMTTYRSAFGYNYEITYPKAWTAILAPRESMHKPRLESYEIYPINIAYGPSPILDIDISNGVLEDYFNEKLEIGKVTSVVLNDLKGYRSKAATDGSVHYAFTLDDKTIISVLYWPNEEYDVSEEEALWVLSTLRVVKE